MRLTKKAKWCFGIGAIGKDAICNVVGIFLMVYITDILKLSKLVCNPMPAKNIGPKII